MGTDATNNQNAHVDGYRRCLFCKTKAGFEVTVCAIVCLGMLLGLAKSRMKSHDLWLAELRHVLCGGDLKWPSFLSSMRTFRCRLTLHFCSGSLRGGGEQCGPRRETWGVGKGKVDNSKEIAPLPDSEVGS